MLFALAALTLAPRSASATAVLPVGSEVRIRASGLGDDWLEGKVGRSANGCMMISLARKAPGGHTSVSLGGTSRLQLRERGTWRDVDAKPLHAAEPADCHGDND